MLAIIADIYSPLLALFCVYYLRRLFNNKWAIAFVLAYLYVYGFAYIEFQFGWWASMESNFSAHTAAVMVLVLALLAVNYKVGSYAFITVLLYAQLMTILDYHSWFDVISTMVVCVPCWGLFSIINRQQRNLF